MISVLCVDDEIDSLDIEKAFLEKFGEIKADTVTTAKDALNILEITHYDAIISDYQMPIMDGIEFLKEVRQKFGDIPFILFTGKGREEIAILALNSGADFYLQKGGDLISLYAELTKKVEKAVSEHQSINALKNSQRRLADIIDFLPDATFAIDIQGKVILWNRAMEELTGVSADMMIGKGDYEYSLPLYGCNRPVLINYLFNPSDEILSFYENIINKGNMLAAEISISNTDGTARTLWAKAGMLYDQKGEIVGAIESIRDISEKKEFEDKLKKSEERYRTLAESSHDLIYIIDRNDNIIYINTFAAQALKNPKTDVVGRPRSEYFPESANKTQWINIKKVFETGAPVRIESKVTFKDHDSWQDTQLIPLKDKNGDVVEVMGVTRDLTQHYEAEEKLKMAHEDLKRLLSKRGEEIQRLYKELIQESQKGP